MNIYVERFIRGLIWNWVKNEIIDELNGMDKIRITPLRSR